MQQKVSDIICHKTQHVYLHVYVSFWIAACIKLQAECAITYVPYFEECLKRDNGIGVASAQKYERLYESCANIDEAEVGILITDLDEMIDNPKCQVNTSGIAARVGNFSMPKPKRKAKKCKDDDKGLGRVYRGQTCLKAASSDKGCSFP